MAEMADVAIISGSASDAKITDKVKKVLDENRVSYDAQIISAHRDPDKLEAYIKASEAKIFIAIARPFRGLARRYCIQVRQTGYWCPGERDAERYGCTPLDRPDAKRCPRGLRGCGQW